MMKDFFGLRGNPFEKGQVRTDPFSCRDHTEMASRLRYLVNCGGLGVFTAAPGMGKTYAVHAFMDALNPNQYTTAYMCLTTLGLSEFYSLACSTLGLDSDGRRNALFTRLRNYIENLKKVQRQPLVFVIDEAQYLRHEVLDDLKILMNYNYDSENYFSLILLGETRLAYTLQKPIHEALRQRIVVHYSFEGLTGEETRGYIEHKLRSAGGSASIVNEGVCKTIYSLSHGNPREIDRLMTQALLIASQTQQEVLDDEILHSAALSLSLN